MSTAKPKPKTNSDKRRCSCRWAPLFRIPLERRLQTLAVLVGICIFPLTMVLNVVLLFSPLWPLYLLYVAWFVLLDRNTPNHGGRNPVARRLWFWRAFRDYFPSELTVEEPLDANKTYVFGIHPHGVIGMGIWANALNSCVPELSHLKYRLVTLATNFWIPVTREWLLSLGVIGSDKHGILRALRSGLSVMIVVGGAAEALEIHDDYHGVVLERRKGFVELALRTGSSLVPVFNFGENELYAVATDNKPGTRVRTAQEKMKDWFGWTLPLVHGRGIWNYTFGLLPFRKPIVTVIGKPIPVEKIEQPSKEDIDKYHAIYKRELLELHERWRVRVGQTAKLKIIA